MAGMPEPIGRGHGSKIKLEQKVTGLCGAVVKLSDSRLVGTDIKSQYRLQPRDSAPQGSVGRCISLIPTSGPQLGV